MTSRHSQGCDLPCQARLSPSSAPGADIFIITNFPEAEAATGLALALALTGSFRVTTTPLLTAKDMGALLTP